MKVPQLESRTVLIIGANQGIGAATVKVFSAQGAKGVATPFGRSAVLEVGKYGITIYLVAPGPAQTGWLAPEQERQIAATTSLGRVGKPEEVADVIVFPASEQAHWLGRQLLYVGGGWRTHQ